MKTLTLIQPWATLIALGEKRIETRSWKTSYRGPLLIHAGKKIDKVACEEYFIKGMLQKHGYASDNLPTGLIIAKCELIDCIEIDLGTDGRNHIAHLKNGLRVDNNEYCFGDYTPGRYAWILDNIEILKEPIPAKGKLSLWEFEEGPDAVEKENLPKRIDVTELNKEADRIGFLSSRESDFLRKR